MSAITLIIPFISEGAFVEDLSPLDESTTAALAHRRRRHIVSVMIGTGSSCNDASVRRMGCGFKGDPGARHTMQGMP